MRGYAPLTFALTTTALALLAGLSSSERVALAARAPKGQYDLQPVSPRRVKATLPVWALAPAGAKLVIVAYHDSAPPELAFGIADVRINQSAAEAVARYAETLRNQGWHVETARLATQTGAPRARTVHYCLVEARRGANLLRLSLEQGEASARGSLLWARNLPGPAIGAMPGAC